MGEPPDPRDPKTEITSAQAPQRKRVGYAYGDRVGQFQIIELLGEGGMGAVYAAQQSSPRREIALKLIRPGHVGSDAMRRFLQESEALARLKHPGIAQVYEAGVHEEGNSRIPFFAMELVDGRPLTEFLIEHDAGIDERLDLMARVCDAVQHAHTKGVIHRDLKPDNILVTEDGRPKILDFGVARVTDSDVKGATIQTQVGQIIGTLPYMSPEQVSGDPNEIDTRSDVYALGVMLHEALSGKRPLAFEGVSIAEAVRMIREVEPMPLASEDRRFRGDLDTIVGKALEKDRDRRYASPAALAADIRRVLEDQPIAARPPSTVYQLRKFAKRNKVLMGSAAVLIVVLIAATILSTAFAIGQSRARHEAERAVARQQRVDAFFLGDLLGSIDRDAARGRDVTMREVVDRAAERVSREADPEIQALIRARIGQLYKDLYRINDALAQLTPALAIVESRSDIAPDVADRVRVGAAELLLEKGEVPEADRVMREAIQVRERRFGAQSPEVASLVHKHAAIMLNALRLSEAAALNDRAAMILEPRADDADAKLDLAEVCSVTGFIAMMNGDIDSALQQHRRALQIRKSVLESGHSDIARSHYEIARTLRRQGELDEARRSIGSALDIRRERLGERTPPIAQCLNLMGLIAIDAGDDAGAEVLLREAAEIYGIHYDDQPSAFPERTRLHLAGCLARLDRQQESDALYARCIVRLDALEQMGENVRSVRIRARQDWAESLRERGHTEQAAKLSREASEIAALAEG